MGRHASLDRCTNLSISLPLSIQTQLNEHVAAKNNAGVQMTNSSLIKMLLLQYLAGNATPASQPTQKLIVPASLQYTSTAPGVFNDGLPPGFSTEDWEKLMATGIAPGPQPENVLDMIKRATPEDLAQQEAERDAATQAKAHETQTRLEKAHELADAERTLASR